MSSSTKHWPSLFKSKPSSSNQRHHDNSLRAGVEERTPEPKPRWNPKPEQIRILEAIFNSGVVNPSREEIRRIRIRLEEYGEVGDANVFYWFQNRKSRSKHKQRQLQSAISMAVGVELQQQKPSPSPPPPPPPPPAAVTFLGNNPIMTGSSSTSSSSDNSTEQMGLTFFTNSPTGSVNQQHQQALYQTPNDFLAEPYFYPQGPNDSGAGFTQGFIFPDSSDVPLASDLTIGTSSGILPSELMGFNSLKGYDNEGINLDPQLGYGTVTSLSTTTVTATNASHAHSLLPPPSTTVPSTLYHFQGLRDEGAAGVELQKVTVFINGMEVEVPARPFDVRGTFGDEAVLIHYYSGQPVMTNEWGLTLHPLQNGALYYVVRPSTSSDTDLL